MIKSIIDLNRYLNKENYYYYIGSNNKKSLKGMLFNEPLILIHNYLIFLRKEEYYYNTKGCFNKLLYVYYRRKKNRLGARLGFSIEHNCFGEGLTLYHHGSIIVNGEAKIGENCKLHGENCIGNNGLNNKVPILGDNIDIGVGAKIIGDVRLGNNIKIGANAVVLTNIPDNCTVVGIPAKIIKRNGKKVNKI